MFLYFSFFITNVIQSQENKQYDLKTRKCLLGRNILTTDVLKHKAFIEKQ